MCQKIIKEKTFACGCAPVVTSRIEKGPYCVKVCANPTIKTIKVSDQNSVCPKCRVRA